MTDPTCDPDEFARLQAVEREVEANLAEPGHITRAEIREALAATATPRPVLCPVTPDDRDTTADLAAWLTGLPAGSSVSLGASEGRVYRIDGALKVDGASGLTISDAAVRVAVPSAELDSQGRSLRRHLWFTHCTDLTLDRISVVGQNVTDDDGAPVDQDGQAAYDPKREWEHALAVEDCDRITVTGLTADAIYGDGAYWRRVTDGHLDGFTVSRNGRQGVAMVSTSGLRLLNGVIRHGRRSGVDLEPNSPDEMIQDVEIGHLNIRSRLLPVTAGGPGTVRDVHVHDMIVRSGSVPTLSLVPNHDGRRDGWTVERWTTNASLGSSAPAVRGSRVDGLVLRDMTVPCTPGRKMTAIGLDQPGIVEITGCDFPGAAQLLTVTHPAPNHAVTESDNSLTQLSAADS